MAGLALEAVNPLFSRGSPSIYNAAVQALDGHLKSPRVVVNVRPTVSDYTKVTGERVHHHEDDIHVLVKLIGLAKHVGEGVGNVVALNNHLLGEH
jgi:hypothetical protein